MRTSHNGHKQTFKNQNSTKYLELKLQNTPSQNVDKDDIVYKTCLLLVTHFRNLLVHSEDNLGFHTRIFSHFLHPEEKFVFAGKSKMVTSDTPTHPEHVVPCAVLINECKRLINEGQLSYSQIAKLLRKHWRLARITKAEQAKLDFELGHKSTMPSGWRFETGNTFERFRLAEIELLELDRFV